MKRTPSQRIKRLEFGEREFSTALTDLQKRVQYLEQVILNLPKPAPKKRGWFERWTWL